MSGAVVLILALLLVACGHNFRNVSVFAAGPDAASFKYAVMPFASRLPPEQMQRHPDAHEILRELVEANLLSSGISLVERSRIDALLTEHSLVQSGLTADEGLRIGRLLQADAVLIGTVHNFFGGGEFRGRSDYTGRYTTVGFTIKAIHVESGRILWTASSDREVRSCFYASIFPQSYSVETVHELMEELIAEMGKSRRP